jgi:hypothetical protein
MEEHSVKQCRVEEFDSYTYEYKAVLFNEEDGGVLDTVRFKIEAADRDDATFILDEAVGDIAEDFEGILVDYEYTLTDVH